MGFTLSAFRLLVYFFLSMKPYFENLEFNPPAPIRVCFVTEAPNPFIAVYALLFVEQLSNSS